MGERRKQKVNGFELHINIHKVHLKKDNDTYTKAVTKNSLRLLKYNLFYTEVQGFALREVKRFVSLSCRRHTSHP